MSDKSIRYRVTGMDCPSCATKIEKSLGGIPNLIKANVSIASQILTLQINGEQELGEIEQTIINLGYKLVQITDGNAELSKKPPNISPIYKRALWIVVLLNVGYGMIEIFGGYIAHSQALKADALDFLGDGLITLSGIIAIGWSMTWRARSALVQGFFLGGLGLYVFISTIFRAFILQQPQAELMGIFGIIALCVNVCAAFVLLPHRSGDANVRAVWLFSRNDAIGNVAVVVAAVFVAWTGSVWPDLIVAAIVAGLFLHSSLSIIKHARADLS